MTLVFSISELAKLSGIKVHTIRIWELRYDVLHPKRSTGNTRYYSIDELEHFLSLALLNHYGKKINTLIQYTSAEINSIVNSLDVAEVKLTHALNKMILCYYKADVECLENILEHIVSDHGYSVTIEQVIIPFLEKTDMLSYNDSGFATHFAVTVIRKKLLAGIDATKSPEHYHRKALLYLPEKEHYDLILLYTYFVLKSRGVRVYYLGTNISEKNLKDVIHSVLPDDLYVYTIYRKKYDYHQIADYLKNEFPHINFVIITAEHIDKPVGKVKIQHFMALNAD